MRELTLGIRGVGSGGWRVYCCMERVNDLRQQKCVLGLVSGIGGLYLCEEIANAYKIKSRGYKITLKNKI